MKLIVQAFQQKVAQIAFSLELWKYAHEFKICCNCAFNEE